MSVCNIRVNISPKEALEIVKENVDAYLVHEESITLEDGRSVETLIYDKYYIRAGNSVALVVIIENIEGTTGIRSVATGSSSSLFSNFDWGAASDFAEMIPAILDEYIIEVIT
ncbi:DUF6054 family protein [Alkaliphilus transvaalensis]|uniref:DUF6054 family protein n=1 Tax=Alkaliphilus transvaalensis TaxID=114628 RepID=UPI000479EE22|nr:DUF6054 family protein [Alkaliphilus transvaalensis]